MVRGLARSLAKDGITVNAVSPGPTDTAMFRQSLDEAGLANFAAPSALAGTVLFLASRHASFVTGATINVSGG